MRRPKVNWVPVTACPAIGAADRLTAVKTGLVAGGWIEITSGLPGGAAVRPRDRRPPSSTASTTSSFR